MPQSYWRWNFYTARKGVCSDTQVSGACLSVFDLFGPVTFDPMTFIYELNPYCLDLHYISRVVKY